MSHWNRSPTSGFDLNIFNLAFYFSCLSNGRGIDIPENHAGDRNTIIRTRTRSKMIILSHSEFHDENLYAAPINEKALFSNNILIMSCLGSELRIYETKPCECIRRNSKVSPLGILRIHLREILIMSQRPIRRRAIIQNADDGSTAGTLARREGFRGNQSLASVLDFLCGSLGAPYRCVLICAGNDSRGLDNYDRAESVTLKDP